MPQSSGLFCLLDIKAEFFRFSKQNVPMFVDQIPPQVKASIEQTLIDAKKISIFSCRQGLMI